MSSRNLGLLGGVLAALVGMCASVACSGDGPDGGLLGTSTGGSGIGGNSSGGEHTAGGALSAGAGADAGSATVDGGASSAVGGGGSDERGNPLTPGETMDCDPVEPGASGLHIEVECAYGHDCPNGVTGNQSGTELENGNTTVGYFDQGDWLGFENVALDGISTLSLSYAKEVSGGQLEVRIDSPTGDRLGSWSPPVTGSWSSWQEANFALDGTSGTHALYLVGAGSTEGILNLDWVELSAGEGRSTSGGGASAFHLNHLGFATLGPKHAVVEGPAGLERFSVVDTNGDAMWCGELEGQSFSAWGDDGTFYSVDFTGLTRPGSYQLRVGSATSEQFEVADAQLFDSTFARVLGYFHGARADDPDVWDADQSVPFCGRSGTADVRGGWYDASGDISKYLSHLSYANYMNPQQIPLVAWALAWVHDEGGDLVDSQASAVQEEALWGADYLLRVLDPEGYFYVSVFDGWSGDPGQRGICAVVGQSGSKSDDYQSAMREGGGMSIAALARIARWGASGDFSADEYLAGAEAAFDHLNTNGAQYTDDGTENVIDDYAGLLAASELYAATEDSGYLEAARQRAASLIGRLSSEGYFIADGDSRPFWHASDAGLPVVALARYARLETDGSRRTETQAAIRAHLDYLLTVTREVTNPYGYARQHTSSGATSFFIPHANETGYWWQGENARLGSLAAAALIGGDAIGADGDEYLELMRFAGQQIDWVLGANPYDICFLRGSGRNNPPRYSGEKDQVGSLAGGISNGITGANDDGSGIAWMGGEADWEQWPWVEQWLPHAAWYIVAITAQER